MYKSALHIIYMFVVMLSVVLAIKKCKSIISEIQITQIW